MPVVMKSHSPLSVLSSFNPAVPSTPYHLCKNANRILLKKLLFPQNLGFCGNYSIWKASHVSFCYAKDKDISEGFPEIEKLADSEELELLDKPSPMPVNGDTDTLENEPKRPDKNAALEPFLKFFRTTDMEEEVEPAEQVVAKLEEESDKVIVEYYEPKPGDFVVGVVVSGNENKLDVNIGADLLGTMLTKEVLPLYDKEMDYMLRDLDKNADDFIANGKMGIVRNEDALSGQPVSGRPVVDAGTVLFAEVLGRTLSGRPLLSTRRYFRRIAWHRVRQMKHLGEPIEVRITEWNTGGLLTRVEGLRAFLPKIELVDRVNSFTELKEKVGHWIYVQISRINEENNDLILSEREAWEKSYLREGILLEGTVRKIFPYGAQVKIGQTNRSGLLHVTKISRGKFDSVSDLLAVGEKVKVLVVRSLFPGKDLFKVSKELPSGDSILASTTSFFIADLESEPGLFISDRQRVFAEAEEMARKYRRKLPRISANHKSLPPPSNLLFEDESSLYANWSV